MASGNFFGGQFFGGGFFGIRGGDAGPEKGTREKAAQVQYRPFGQAEIERVAREQQALNEVALDKLAKASAESAAIQAKQLALTLQLEQIALKRRLTSEEEVLFLLLVVVAGSS